MSIELIGLFSHAPAGSGIASENAVFDLDFVGRLLRDYEKNDYDRMLIANSASWADSIPVAAYVAAVTTRLKFMIAHRPGFVAPTMAARMLATVDQVSGGRAGVHIITGANDVEMQADGDFLPKADRYHRSAEYAKIMREVWTASKPVDHDGPYYRFNQQNAKVRPIQGSIPIFWGGASGAALEAGASAADVYAFGIEPLDRSRKLIAEVRNFAKGFNRDIGFCVSSKIITAETEEGAWKYAHEIRDMMEERARAEAPPASADLGANARRLEMAKLPDIQDERLWMGLNKIVGGRGHTVTLVGAGEQVAEALLKYYDLGVRSFLFHGYDTPNDPDRYGKSMIPALRAGAAAREKAGRMATA
jgi:alkanesulfonate monooxygenase